MNAKILIAGFVALSLLGATLYLTRTTPTQPEEIDYPIYDHPEEKPIHEETKPEEDTSNNSEYLNFTQVVNPYADMNDNSQSKCYKMEESCSCNAYSIFDWAKCYRNKVPKCSDAPAHLVNDCYKAASLVSELVYPDVKNILNSCWNFYHYFERTTADTPLNWHNYYQCCFTDCRVLKRAQISSWYFKNIYSPLYLECGNVRY